MLENWKTAAVLFATLINSCSTKIPGDQFCISNRLKPKRTMEKSPSTKTFSKMSLYILIVLQDSPLSLGEKPKCPWRIQLGNQEAQVSSTRFTLGFTPSKTCHTWTGKQMGIRLHVKSDSQRRKWNMGLEESLSQLVRLLRAECAWNWIGCKEHLGLWCLP